MTNMECPHCSGGIIVEDEMVIESTRNECWIVCHHCGNEFWATGEIIGVEWSYRFTEI